MDEQHKTESKTYEVLEDKVKRRQTSHDRVSRSRKETSMQQTRTCQEELLRADDGCKSRHNRDISLICVVLSLSYSSIIRVGSMLHLHSVSNLKSYNMLYGCKINTEGFVNLK